MLFLEHGAQDCLGLFPSRWTSWGCVCPTSSQHICALPARRSKRKREALSPWGHFPEWHTLPLSLQPRGQNLGRRPHPATEKYSICWAAICPMKIQQTFLYVLTIFCLFLYCSIYIRLQPLIIRVSFIKLWISFLLHFCQSPWYTNAF